MKDSKLTWVILIGCLVYIIFQSLTVSALLLLGLGFFIGFTAGNKGFRTGLLTWLKEVKIESRGSVKRQTH